MAMATTTWVTPRRLARGPEAANRELERWGARRSYRDRNALLRDAERSRAAGLGSAILAGESHRGQDAGTLILITAGVVGFALWLGTRWRRANTVTDSLGG